MINILEKHIQMPMGGDIGSVDTTYTIYEPLRILVNKLKRKKPNWTFIVRIKEEKRITMQSTAFCSVRVVEDGAVLGAVSVGHEYSGRAKCSLDTYKVVSKHIKTKRGSRHTAKTTKEAVALRTCFAMLRRDTETEVKERVSMELASVIANKVSHTNSLAESEVRKLTLDALSYAKANREAFSTMYPKHLTTFLTIDSLAEETDIVNKISTREKVVLVADNTKLRVFAGDGTKLFEDDLDGNALPEWVRRKFGLLKLVAAKQFVRDVGVRVTDTVFAITTEEQGEA